MAKQKAKERTAKQSRYLRYDFTDTEQLANGKKLGEVGQAIRRLDEELTQVKSQFKFIQLELEALKGKLESHVTTGYEMRNVPVTITFNKPKNGKKSIIRDDTGAQVAVEDMTQDARRNARHARLGNGQQKERARANKRNPGAHR